MPLQLTVHHDLPYLLVEVSGRAQLADQRGIIDMVASICADTRCRRCLFDLRTMQADLSFTEQLLLGTYVGEKLRTLEKVATLVTPALSKGTSLKAAQKQGAHANSFTDIQEAIAWITS